MNAIKWDGKPITNPGIYDDIPLGTYHSQEITTGYSVSSSGLRRVISKSPKHFYAEWSGNPNRKLPKKEPRHFIFGRAIHSLFLGEKGFGSLYITEPPDYEDEKTGEVKKWNNNATHCRNWHAARKEEGRSVLKPDDAEAIIEMAKEFSRHETLMPKDGSGGIMHGKVERSFFYVDEATGLWVKTRPDVTPDASVDFADYKTTTSTVWADLRWAISNFGYDQQGELVITAARKLMGLDSPRFHLVFQEKEDPYCIRITEIEGEDLVLGAKLNRLALDTIARCLDSGVWPGPGGYRDDSEKISRPESEKLRMESLLQHGLS